MFAKISELNRISFKEILRNLCDDINLQVTQITYNQLLIQRNKLIHEGKFLCQSENLRINIKT